MQELWSFLTSLKLTIAVLIILSLTSIIGTVIPQNEAPQKYLQIYTPSTYEWFKLLSLDKMYHSWWFTAVLALFTLNLLSCSFKRFPGFWRIITKKEQELTDQLLKSLSLKKTFRLKEWSTQTGNEISRIVQKHLHKPTTHTPSPGTMSLFAEKGKYTRTGFHITHIGIALIIIGGILGNYGYQGYMTVLEGGTNDTLTLRGTTQQRKLDFSVRCDDFEVTYYEGSQRPKDFKSDLVIIDGGKEVIKKTIEVNDPLSYKGVYIYQSSYGTAPGQGAVLIGVQPTSGEKKTAEYKMNIGERIALDKTGYAIELKRFVPDFTLGQNNEVVSRSQEPRNPAAQLAVFKDTTLLNTQWVFAKFPDFHGQEKGEFAFKLLNFFGKEYTGLQLTRDPGVWVVWTGCFMLTLGCCLIFFMSHQRLWIKVEPKKGEYIVTMAGTSNKNQESFKRTFELAHQELKKIGKASSNA